MDDFLTRISKLPAERLALLAAELRARLDDTEAAIARRNDPIAIVGIGCRFPGGENPEAFWRALRDGRDMVREVPPERWDAERLHDPDPDAPGKAGTRWGSFLDGVDLFDARFFGIAPREALSIDPQQRLLLEVAWEALEDAGIAADRLHGEAGGVFVGLCNHDYHDIMLEHPLEQIDGYRASGVAGSMAAGRIAYLLGLHGPALTVDTACSSSLVALHLACESLRSGEARLALAGGANLILGVDTTVGLTKAHMLSPGGRCRTFDAAADGIVRGEGCGVVVLERLNDARANGHRVLAVIRATALNQDGRSSGITAPNGPAQEALMRAALARAGIDPRDVDYIEAHGTGTRLGDPIEVRALGEVYGAADRPAPLRIGSVKTNLGHLEAAAGIAGVIKAVLALRHREIPPHLHFSAPNPLIPWEQFAIEVPTRRMPWAPGASDRVRRAAVSSFGFSGTNAHVIIEEAPAAEQMADSPLSPDRPAHVLPITAVTESALRRLALAYAEKLDAADEPFTDICYTAAVGRAKFPERLAVVAANGEEAAGKLRAWATNGESPAGALRGRARGSVEVAFLFTGQGAQWAGMARELFETAPVFREEMLRCAGLFESRNGRSLLEVIYPPAGETGRAAAELDRTRWTQPALFAIEVALAALWRSWGVEPAAVVGHSIGEYAAAVIAGALTLEDAAHLVATRARVMDELPEGGTMVAVLAPAELVEPVLVDHPAVNIAGYNAPANTVISGPAAAVGDAVRALGARGIECRPLAVSHAFHSPLMDPALDALEQAAAGVRVSPPELTFASTLTGQLAGSETLGVPAYWRDQARQPVRFTSALATLHSAGHRVFLEIGPHPTLCGLGTQVLDGADAVFVPSLRRGKDAWTEMLQAAATLFVHGVDIDWEAFDAPWPRRRVSLPTYPFERTSYWIGWSRRGRDDGTVVPGPTVARDDDAFDGQLPEPPRIWTREWVEIGAAEGGETQIAAPADIARRLAPRARALVDEHGGEVYSRFLPRLDELCTAYILQALRRLGADIRVGATIDESALSALGVQPRHRRLVRRILDILAEDGFLEGDGSPWRWIHGIAEPTSDTDTLARSLLRDFPACRPEIEVTVRCGEQLAGALTGEVDPMSLLFPGGSLDPTEQLYGDTPSFRIFNTLVAEAVCGALPPSAGNRKLRILEVGAGTGGTTARLLPLLDAGTTEYAFTDVSPLFLERARERFREFGFVDYRLLDISRDPDPQGFEDGTWDVVVASNVLHATPDLRASLEHVRRLVAPGGALVLLEAVRPQRFGDLTVGLTPGWWSFTDHDLRRDYALLSTTAWLDLLESAGFVSPASLPAEPDGRAVLVQQSVLVARAPTTTARAGQQDGWLVLAREGQPSGRFAQRLRAAGLPIRNVAESVPVPERGSQGAGAPPTDIVAAPSAPVLHLLALDEATSASDDAAAVMERQQRTAGSALEVMRTATASAHPARMVFVTHGAQQTDRESLDPVGAPIWGLGRTLALEHPEIDAIRVDLDDESDLAAAALARLLARTPTGEDELAVRAGKVRAPRVAPGAEPLPQKPSFDPEGAYVVTGGLRGLGSLLVEWLARHGAGRVVVNGRASPSAEALELLERVRAAGTDVQVITGDIADPATATALVSAAGPDRLRGVFHCAGTTEDAAFVQQSWPRLERVMAAKVAGAWNLHVATRVLRLDRFVLFSSAAAFLGSAGQANHAAANAYLGALARYRRALSLPGLAVDWGPWTETGAATRGDVLDRARAAGLGALDPEEGFDLLGRLMITDSAHVAIVPVEWQHFFARHPGARERRLFERVRNAGPPPASRANTADGVRRSGRPEPGPAAGDAAGKGALRQAIDLATPANRRTVLFEGVHAEAARVLGLAAAERIDPDTPLTELGLDSLMAVELRNAISHQLDQPLPATLLFNYPTLAELAGHLGRRWDETDRTDDLSDDEVAELLERKLRNLQPAG